jgi:hypothetical protein
MPLSRTSTAYFSPAASLRSPDFVRSPHSTAYFTPRETFSKNNFFDPNVIAKNEIDRALRGLKKRASASPGPSRASSASFQMPGLKRRNSELARISIAHNAAQAGRSRQSRAATSAPKRITVNHPGRVVRSMKSKKAFEKRQRCATVLRFAAGQALQHPFNAGKAYMKLLNTIATRPEATPLRKRYGKPQKPAKPTSFDPLKELEKLQKTLQTRPRRQSSIPLRQKWGK